MSSSSSSPCAVGRYLHRKCIQACVFAAYFPPDRPTKFANVHKVFGASRVAKILDTLSTSQREDAVNSLAFEVGGLGTPSNMLLGHQQQHLYEAQLVDVSDVGFAPIASVNELIVIFVAILSEGCIGRVSISVLRDWLFSSPNRVLHGRRGLFRSGLFGIAHGEYFHKMQLFGSHKWRHLLLVIGVAKVSHFEILYSVHWFEPTVGLFCCFYVNYKASSKSMSRDAIPKSFEFNAEHYATLVAYPAPFHKYPEPFLYLVGMSRNYTLDENNYPQFLQMDLHSFIRTANHTKIRIGKRQHGKLKASVDKLFDEGGSGEQVEQGHFASGGKGAGVKPIGVAEELVAEDVAPLQPRCQKKRKTIVAGAGEPSYPLKKLREDHRTLSGASIGGKSRFAVQGLLVGAAFNAKVRGGPIPTLPFVTYSISATPDREGEGHTDSVTELNLRTVSAPPSATIITAATTVTLTVDPAVVTKEKIIKPSLLSVVSASAGGTDPAMGCFADLSGNDFLVSGIRTIISLDTDLQKMYIHQWSVTNGSCLDDGRVSREMVDEFAPPKSFPSICRMEHDQLFTEFNVGAARQMSLSAELSMRAKYNIKEKRRKKEKNELDVKVVDLAASVKVKEQEVIDLDVVVTFVKSWNDNIMKQLEKFQDEQMKVVNDKFDKLYADFIEMALHLEDRFCPHLLTTIVSHRWLLTYGIELAIAKCLNSSEYLSALGAAIGKAIEKGMQDGLAVGITHGKEGRVLVDVAAYSPSTEVDYVSALQEL
nr:hypothetical protein [Tanacetum cinerariifolium]